MANILYFEVGSGSGGSAWSLKELLAEISKHKFSSFLVATKRGSATTEIARMGNEVIYMRRKYLGDSLGIVPALIGLSLARIEVEPAGGAGVEIADMPLAGKPNKFADRVSPGQNVAGVRRDRVKRVGVAGAR